MEVLGTGTGALLLSPLTDPDNNGVEAAGAGDLSWNWKSITANSEPGFNATPVVGTPAGTERSYNVFDHLATGGGAVKWCCGEPLSPNSANAAFVSPTNPLFITVEFYKKIQLTHFTLTSGNDTPGRDPRDWRIVGSTNGTTWEPIFTQIGTNDPATTTESLWGSTRDQVNRFDLDVPSKPYTFLRFECSATYLTPGTTAAYFQIDEIEYFGTVEAGPDLARVSDPFVAPSFASIKVLDGPESKLDPATIQFLVNGVAVTNTVSKTGDLTVITHLQTPLYGSGSSNSWAFTAKDNLGNSLNKSGSFLVNAYTSIQAGYALASADLSKPGFKIKMHQMEVNRNPNSNGGNNPGNQVPLAQRQLADGYINPLTGAPYDNLADLSLAGPDGYFVETDLINYNEAAPAATGSFSLNSNPPYEDKPVPGIPGGNGTEKYVASIETILQLKAGYYQFGVNSDDGFRLSFGRGPGDVIGTQLGTAGDRGVADTVVDVIIPVDGFYPVRVMWWENAGGSACEFFFVDVLNGTKMLVNDLSVASLVKSYRESAVSRPYISKALPVFNYAYAFADQDVIIDITDGAIPLTAGSAVLTINGAAQTITANKAGKVTTLRRAGSLSNLLFSGANNVVLVYGFTEGGANITVTNTWAFTVPAYTRIIPAANKVAANQVGGSGFHIRAAHQIDRSVNNNQGNGGRHTGNNMPGPEIQLNNGYINPLDNQPYPNLIDISNANPDGSYDVPEVLNFNHSTATALAANSGIFNGDTMVPGLPGKGSSASSATLTPGLDNSVHEFQTYLELKAGAYIFGLNVDDGWIATSAPNPRDTLGTLLGFRNGPGGNAGAPVANPNGAFNVIVPEDGIYPFRILFWEGGGGVNIEFLSVDRQTGVHILVNDQGTAYPSTVPISPQLASPVKAYNTYSGPVRPWTKFSVYPTPYVAVQSPLLIANTAVTLWQNRDQQTGPGLITRKLGLLNGNWNSGEVQNSATAQRPFGDAVGAIVADLGAGTVGMVLDGVSVTPTVTSVPNSTDKLVMYTPSTPLSSASNHIAGLVYAGTTNYWHFSVITNVILAASNSLPSSAADLTARGFHVKVAQAAAARPLGNTAAGAEAQLAGTPASVTPPGPNADGSYTIPGIINLNVSKSPGNTVAEIGNFQPLMGGPADEAPPGIPGTGLTGAGRFENFTAEICAYLDLPAGYQKFGVNGDDGFRVLIGVPGQTNGPVLFTQDRGAGAQDFPIAFITPQAGLYPVRLVWYQGGGGGNVEFFTYGTNGEKIPVNADRPDAVKAYYKATAPVEPPKFTGIKVNADRTLTITWTGGGTLEAATSVTGPWVAVPGATSPFTFPPTATTQFGRIRQ